MISRTIASLIRKDSRGYPVVGILGPRQSGKTTLVKHIFPAMNYVNLEDPDQRLYAEQDPRGFLSDHTQGMIIDEFQRVPDLLSYIQTISDMKGTPGQFILTGSQNYLMMEKNTQSLAGRISLFHLFPLSLNELYPDGREMPVLNEIIYKGFFPRLHKEKMDCAGFYRNYTQTYLERDVRQLRNITDLGSFQAFLRLCAGRTGQVVNLSSLGNDLGVNHNTIKSWLHVLEAGYIIHHLTPYFRNYGKQITKSPKIYFYDTGLLCSLLGINSPEMISQHYLKGGIFENFVINEIKKWKYNQGKLFNEYFWRDKLGREIDLLIDEGNNRFVFEIKAGQTLSVDFFSNLDYYGGLDESCPPENRYLVYGGPENQTRSQGVVRSWNKMREIDKAFGIS
ncbi:MAG: ATP-binding protein [Spirochaetales bacterium]|nr:ATP-binding protein [Spirochaetales bacterium]